MVRTSFISSRYYYLERNRDYRDNMAVISKLDLSLSNFVRSCHFPKCFLLFVSSFLLGKSVKPDRVAVLVATVMFFVFLSVFALNETYVLYNYRDRHF